MKVCCGSPTEISNNFFFIYHKLSIYLNTNLFLNEISFFTNFLFCFSLNFNYTENKTKKDEKVQYTINSK